MRGTFTGKLWTQHKQQNTTFKNPSEITVVESTPERGLRTDKLCQGMNSGYQAINLAYMNGAKVVLLLGYVMGGKGDHYFGRHPSELDQDTDYSAFIHNFELMKPEEYGLKVINCTENTALKCFPKMDIQVAIDTYAESPTSEPVPDGWAECVVIASGPSLTHEAVEIVKKWRFEPGFEGKRGVIVTNNSYKIAPWADVLYAMDQNWWDRMGAEAVATFPGEKITNKSVKYPGVKQGEHFVKARAGMNSGSGAISVAVHRGAENLKIFLLGCDGCYIKDGKPSFDSSDPAAKKHWHGDHIKGLGNAKSVPKFKDQFERIGQHFKTRALIVNCSPVSVIDCFPKISITEALCKTK